MRRMLAAAASAALLAGCGGTRQSGRALFMRECGACHTISGADSPSHQGGDLLRVHLPRSVLLQFMREMPVHPRPDAAQLHEVARYILAVQRGPR
jgi:mono/diheme cytochrome c family protein